MAQSTFWKYVANNDELAERYARAKVQGLHAVAAEMLDIADEPRPGVIVTEGPKGTETKTGDMVERARLQIETRKWLLARLMPKVYGDRTIIAGDAENPLAIEHTDAVGALLSRPAIADGEEGTAGANGETVQ